MNTDRIREFVKKTQRKRQLKAEIRELDAELDKMDPEIQEDMLSAGVSNVKIDGYTVYLHSQVWAGVDYEEGESKDEGYERACEALKAAGAPEFVKTRFHTGSVSAWIRERIRDLEVGDDIEEALPEELRGAVKVTERVSVRARSA